MQVVVVAYVLLSLQKSKIYIRKGMVIQTMKPVHIWQWGIYCSPWQLKAIYASA